MNIYVICQVLKYKEFDVIQGFLAKSRWFKQNLDNVKLIVFLTYIDLFFIKQFCHVWCTLILREKGFQIKS